MKKNGVTREMLYGLLAIGVAGQAGIAKGEGLLSNDGMLAAAVPAAPESCPRPDTRPVPQSLSQSA